MESALLLCQTRATQPLGTLRTGAWTEGMLSSGAQLVTNDPKVLFPNEPVAAHHVIVIC